MTEEQGRSSKKDRLKLSKFKLDALLDVTLSINANLPVEGLLARYEEILRENLGIGKILIYKYSLGWECLLNAGFPEKTASDIDPEKHLLQFEDISFDITDDWFEAVDIIIPVFNNNQPLAYVIIGDIDEEGEGVSPVIKHLNFIQTISSIILVAIENIRLHKESLRQEAIKKELELAARMQSMLIPDNRNLPATSMLKVTGYYHSHYEVGGDYYDCIRLSPTRYGFCIADVSGKGISAAILMSNFQASFRALFTDTIGLDTLVHKLNGIVVVNAAGEKFITVFVGRYDTETGQLEFVNAAHNPPVLYDTVTGEVRHLGASCVGVGMLDEIPMINVETLTIDNPSKIVCYTDGLSELKEADGTDIGTKYIISNISNTLPIGSNIESLIAELGIPDNNPSMFDDVSVIAAELASLQR
ncbi:MAG: serine/threonine-protein phosphatase [Bacteroidetes bacterium]|nr:serine/threonine-protein phosphatase [Bacteroidota bacterium]